MIFMDGKECADKNLTQVYAVVSKQVKDVTLVTYYVRSFCSFNGFLHCIIWNFFFFFCCWDFSLHSFLEKLLKHKILHSFAEAAGAEEVAVTGLPPISVAQQEWSLREELDLQALHVLGEYSLLQNKTPFLEGLRRRKNSLPR